MSFDWSEYLNLARQISGSNISCAEEAKQRTAISRAYYSVLIRARHKVSVRLGQPPPRGSTHRWTIEALENMTDKRIQRTGRILRRLKKRREKADYDDTIPNVSNELTTALHQAAKIEHDLAII